ncbi:MAG TPA: peptide ABC transporter substrate-binding protein [Deltaproteobacteria bacterium]|nr:peptide ABC transporter substrate-binding protein [Deltaproteobacteria bacterium]
MRARSEAEGAGGRVGLLSLVIVCFVMSAFPSGCSNNPYPPTREGEKVLYSSFVDAPRTLDPARAYNTRAHAITGAVYDTLLKYHFLKRPLELIPGLAVSLPEKTELPDGRVRYRFELRRDLLFADDACFGLDRPGQRTREVVAADIAFQLARIADAEVGSPVIEPFSNIDGFQEFSRALTARREADPGFAARPVHEQYAELGGIPGVRTPSSHVLDVILHRPYPQIRYWFAMEFSTPVPWEAVEYYDGRGGRPRFDDHPVGTGPYVLSEYSKRSRYVLERSKNWYGVRHPEWKAPAATYPSEGEEEDRLAGRLDYAGRTLPFIDRVEVRREKESIPRFNKFLQGYYDASGIIKESFDKVVQEDALSPEMKARGIALEKAVSPDVFYIGFNFDDPVVGRAGGERSRKLRQAMSRVIDVEEFTRVFNNGRGVPAQSPIPPGIYGYDPDYENPARRVDLERAKQLMVEAGYPGGIDPETGEALRLTFDSADTSSAGLTKVQFYVSAWKRLGIDVRVEATNYNQFLEKLRNGAHQVFESGWVADYPDPENFLFLLWSQMGKSKFGGPNATNFSNARFDELFVSMKTRENGPRRMAEIREMLRILEHERPWIELFHREEYSLYHGWVRNVKPMGISMPTYQYRDLDPVLRAQRRREWNEPIVWPAWVLLGAAVLVVLPGIRTYLKERQ